LSKLSAELGVNFWRSSMMNPRGAKLSVKFNGELTAELKQVLM